MKFGFAAVAVTVVLAASAGSSSGGSSPDVGGVWLFSLPRDPPSTLARLDPLTLAKRGVPLSLGPAYRAHPPDDPDLAAFALDRGERMPSILELVDLRRARVVSRLETPQRFDLTFALRWLDRSLAVTIEKDSVFALDLKRQKVSLLGRLPEHGYRPQIAATRRAYLALLDPPLKWVQRSESPRLAVFDRSGRRRVVRLREMTSVAFGHLVDPRCKDKLGAIISRRPALVASPSREIAYVVGIDRIAEIDLRTLGVRYHLLQDTRRGARRAWYRGAAFVGPGLLAIGGSESEAAPRTQSCEVALKWHDVGALLVDTTTWKIRKHPARGLFYFAADLIVDRARGVLTAYSLDGQKRFRVPSVELGGFAALGSRLYALDVFWPTRGEDTVRTRVTVIERASGRVLARRKLDGLLYFHGRTQAGRVGENP